ncbi:MAG: CHASE2 domain-containing protein [Acidobacteriota bacterium]|nr:CHASE2 domain-containing protein [Acidobacteriota bacterium]
MRATVWVIRAAAIVTLCALALARPTALERADNQLYDGLLRRAPPGQPAAHTAIVAIDEDSLAAFGQWPWPRTRVAHLVDRLQELGASGIALDVLFAESDRQGEADSALAEALTRSRAVVGYAFVFGQAPGDAPCRLHPLDLVQRDRGTALPSDRFFAASGAVCSLPGLADAAGASGFINAAPDPDGVLRRVPLLLRYADRVYPSLSLAAARRATDERAPLVDERGDGSLTLSLGPSTLALDARARVLLRLGSAPTPISAVAIFNGTVPPAAISKRLVFVGSTAIGLRDMVTTPLGERRPGIEMHAEVAENLLAGRVNERPEYAEVWELLLAALALTLVVLVAGRLGLPAAAAAAVGLVGVAWWGAGALLHETAEFLSPLLVWAGVGAGLAGEAVVGLWSGRRDVAHERRRREEAQRLIVQALSSLTETRDADTGQHAKRTQAYTRLLATALAKTPTYAKTLGPAVDLVATLAPLHDLGKVGVPDDVLRKRSSLTPEESEEMRRHPDIGHESLLRAEAQAGVHDDEVLRLAKEIVYTHHERWDGCGYPRGLAGTEIPLSGRLVSLVDVYDAMVARRAYRAAVGHAAAVEFIVRERGRHFDPDVVDAFLSVRDEFERLSRLGPGS